MVFWGGRSHTLISFLLSTTPKDVDTLFTTDLRSSSFTLSSIPAIYKLVLWLYWRDLVKSIFRPVIISFWHKTSFWRSIFCAEICFDLIFKIVYKLLQLTLHFFFEKLYSSFHFGFEEGLRSISVPEYKRWLA